MAGRQIEPASSKHRAVSGTALFLACLLAIPTAAATPQHILCSESDVPTLDVAVTELAAKVVHHDLSTLGLSGHEKTQAADEAIVLRKAILEPRAKAAIREAFEEIAEVEITSDENSAEDVSEEQPKPRVMNTRLPGVSDDRMDRFKRQMFRRDI